MKRTYRLTRTADFKRVRLQGKSYAHPLVVLLKMENDLQVSRIGVVAGKSNGNAVWRNLTKRRLRAALEPYHKKLTPGFDLIFLARRNISNAKFIEIEYAVQQVIRRANLIDRDEE